MNPDQTVGAVAAAATEAATRPHPIAPWYSPLINPDGSLDCRDSRPSHTKRQGDGWRSCRSYGFCPNFSSVKASRRRKRFAALSAQPPAKAVHIPSVAHLLKKSRRSSRDNARAALQCIRPDTSKSDQFMSTAPLLNAYLLKASGRSPDGRTLRLYHVAVSTDRR